MFDKGEYEINENAIKFLIEAKKAGIKHALASASKNAAKLSKKIEVEFNGQKVSLSDLFDINVSGLAPSKKEVFKMALKELKSKFPNLKVFIVVEDAPAGIKAAKELNMLTLGYIREADLKADLTFRDFNEVSLEKIRSLIR
jgi:HAD superfamily hydrolase (TIGR01509 family)